MKNLITQISQAVREPRPQRGGWSVHLAIALSFAVIATGAMVYNATTIQLAQAANVTIEIVSPHSGSTVYWGNGYAMNVDLAGLSGYFDIVLVGEPPVGDPIEYHIYDDILIGFGGVSLAWEPIHDDGYCEFGALSEVWLNARSGNESIDLGVSEPFKIDSLLNFETPADNTCPVPWLGAIPEINYPSGQILPVELALEPFGSDKWWLGGSSAD
ncbi:hypothetical protein JXA59_01625, partial [Patescibacteria group bacterium]|nr:hypothetical protein [Patescibacteria group bacterium]